MIFSIRQIQEKCIEQGQDLYVVFVDLTKAFDTVDRAGLWKILQKIGCPAKFISLIRSFHDGMMARVQESGTTSEPFHVSNGTKQGCVLAPTLFAIVFSCMLADAFKDIERGVYIQLRTDGGLFNLRRLKARTKVQERVIRELLFADDCALVAHSLEDIQFITDCFAHATQRFGLTISLKKTEVLYQTAPGKEYTDPLVTIDNTTLNPVKRFCYLGSMITNTATADEDITQRIAKASASFGRLRHRLWNEHGIRLSTKIKVYKAVVLSTLLYGCETWTVYRRHVKQLDQFHLRCLRSICNIKWTDKVPNTAVLNRCNLPGIESMIIRAQLRWAGHIVRMPDDRIPKALLYGQLQTGTRNAGRPRLRYRDSLKQHLSACRLVPQWEQHALERGTWRQQCYIASTTFEKNRIAALEAKRARRKQKELNPPSLDATTGFPCSVCGRVCGSKIGLSSHFRTHSS